MCQLISYVNVIVPKRFVWICTALIMWLLLLAWGFKVLYQEQFRATSSFVPQRTFPLNSAIPLDKGKLTAVVFVHPHCPCTEATLRQLDSLLPASRDRLHLVMVFALPAGVAKGWENGDLLHKASHLPDCQVFLDRNEVETDRFDVKGSGQVLVYSPRGDLLFSGGITSSRGHDGESYGGMALTQLALTGQTTIHQTPVFGCSLQ